MAGCVDFIHLEQEGREPTQGKTLADKPRRNEPVVQRRKGKYSGQNVSFLGKELHSVAAFVDFQSLSHVEPFATAACQATLSLTTSRSLLNVY